ncbi:hypothetical protein C8F04DRAFT_1247997 [Mycena alexandri]|uniref:DUF6534 domain-containing protein n=1 Tax=Mycena alexandri TaxID=1745969 RepID=A0AAD6TML5_9AGAR|nr:hypothetical protein C8F04DRAFT_1247997 [Mycena alexandri]
MSSNITLSPASRIFVDGRTTTLGPWVLGGFIDSVLMGVVFCQVYNYFSHRRADYGLNRYYTYLVLFVTLLSVLKTSQSIAVVWVQNVLDFANPDVAKNLLIKPNDRIILCRLTTGIIGSVVQSFFALRYYKLSRNWVMTIPISIAIILGLASISMSVYSITMQDAKAKVMWLLIHFVSVFICDFLITTCTCYTLRQRSTGLTSTSSLINRLLRMVFESAVPPAFIATLDLILTQTLIGPTLLWHLLLNYTLSKLYPISLLYTLNSINEYRNDSSSRSHDAYATNRVTRRGDVELAPHSADGHIFIQTQVTTHVSPKITLKSDSGHSSPDHSKPHPF